MSDPTKPTPGTTAIIEIDGLKEPLRQVRQFSVSDDFMQVGDTFSAVVPDPRHELYKKIEMFAGYRFYLQNPAIDGGAPSLRQTGIIRGRTPTGSASGDAIMLKGSDLGWHLQQSAPPFYRLEQSTLQQLLDDLILKTPSWGFKGVKSSNDLNRKQRQGRLAEEIRFQNSLITPFLVIQINPGDTILGVVQEYARRDGLMVNVSADGYLQLCNPNYDQPVSYQLNYHPAGTLLARTNNVLGETSVEENGDLVYSEVTCVWDQLFTGVAQGPFVSNPGRHAATYTRRTGTATDQLVTASAGLDGTLRPSNSAVTSELNLSAPLPGGPKFPRRYVFSDGEPMTPEQGARRAAWQAERMEFDSFVYRASVASHTQDGKWLASDTLWSVKDSVRGINGTLWAPRVRLDADREGNISTSVELHRPGLLSNKRLVLNRVEHRGDGVFVEVQSL